MNSAAAARAKKSIGIDGIIPFNFVRLDELEIKYAREVLASGQLAGGEKFETLVEQQISALYQTNALAVTSCTSALELAALISGIGPGDEFILPSFTFVSTATAFCLRGAKPVFVDINPKTLNIDESLLEAAITPRTRLIVVVHYGGIACAMDAIMNIAKRHGILVVEDAAHGFLASWRGRALGTIGDIGCFSFHNTKTFTCGEGGAFISQDPALFRQAEIARDKGTDRARYFRGEVDKYTWRSLGSSYSMSSLQCAILLGQIERRDEIIATRQVIFTRYSEALAPLERDGLIEMMHVPDDCLPNYHLFYILAKNSEERRSLLNHLKQHGIAATFHYVPLHSSPYAIELGIHCELPVTDAQANRICRLPFYNTLRADEQDHIIDAIYAFYRQKRT
jgi:dTDP-4-amino-4,6-dideoxygalactose transaminase